MIGSTLVTPPVSRLGDGQPDPVSLAQFPRLPNKWMGQCICWGEGEGQVNGRRPLKSVNFKNITENQPDQHQICHAVLLNYPLHHISHQIKNIRCRVEAKWGARPTKNWPRHFIPNDHLGELQCYGMQPPHQI